VLELTFAINQMAQFPLDNLLLDLADDRMSD
jgi:hypothetical protein